MNAPRIWRKPVLTILVRGDQGELILAACKGNEGIHGSQSDVSSCNTRELKDCVHDCSQTLSS